MTREGGSVLPMFAGLLFVSLVILALAVEVAMLGAVWRRTADIADIAAEAGAAMIDERLLHEGLRVVDRRGAGAAAVDAAMGLGTPSGDVTSVVADGSVCVTVRVRHPTVALRFLAVDEIIVTVSRCAVPAVG